MTDWYQKIKGNPKSKDFRWSKAEQTSARMWKQAKSKSKIRIIGQGIDTQVVLSEEERKAHMHIIGTTQEGKSRFLELLVRGDIDRGNGLVFIDPSHNGNTIQRILGYCEEIGFEKVLLIDPHHHHEFGKIVPLNPFYKHRQASIAHVQSIIEVLFDMKNMVQYSFIQNYLPAFLGVLHDAKMTLYESKYFMENDKALFPYQLQVLQQAERNTKENPYIDGIKIKSALTNSQKYKEFGSTLRRLNTITQHETLSFMFGTKHQLDFTKLIKEGWVVLVNVSRGYGMSGMQSKLLATSVINELIFTIERLTHNKWKGRYYLYIDEAGEFANNQLADLLEYKSQAGLAVIVAHQLLDQFENQRIRRSITGMTKLKVAFYQPDHKDRLETAKTLYGGALEDRAVSYALKQLKTQQAVIMLNKKEPQIVYIPDVEEYAVSKDFITGLYESPVYLSPKDIQDEINKRFEGQDSVRADRGGKSYGKATGAASGRKGGHRKQEPPADAKPESGDSDTYSNPAWDDQFS